MSITRILCGALMKSPHILTDGKSKKATLCQKKNTLSDVLYIYYGKIFSKCIILPGYLKTVCNDIFDLYSTHKYFEQTSNQNIAIHAGKGFPSFSFRKQQANNEQTQQTNISPQLRTLHTLVCSFGGLVWYDFISRSNIQKV